jgi:SOS-response transcriptional repressor LexA
MCFGRDMENDLDTPGGRLRFARERAGYGSAGAFAAAIGMNPTSFRAYENNQNAYAKHAPVFAQKLGVSIEWLLRGGSVPDQSSPVKFEAPPSSPAPPAYPDIQSWSKDVPVHGTALGGDLALDAVTQAMQVEQTVLEFADTIEMVRRPPAFANNRALYAVYVAGSSMEPRYEPGDLLYVDPRRPPSIGDDVVVQLRDGNGHDGTDRVISALIKRLVRRTGAGVELEQYNPPLRFKIAGEHIAAVHRVVKLGEVVGV